MSRPQLAGLDDARAHASATADRGGPIAGAALGRGAGGRARVGLLGVGLLVVDVVLPVPSSLVVLAQGTAFGVEDALLTR